MLGKLLNRDNDAYFAVQNIVIVVIWAVILLPFIGASVGITRLMIRMGREANPNITGAISVGDLGQLEVMAVALGFIYVYYSLLSVAIETTFGEKTASNVDRRAEDVSEGMAGGGEE